MLLNPLADALSSIKNCEAVGKDVAHISPVNNIISEALRILKEKGYIQDARYIENNKGGIYKVKLDGSIHNIKAIKPRFPVKNDEIKEWAREYLPSYALGYLIMTTSEGVMTHREAQERNIGGKLIAYVY